MTPPIICIVGKKKSGKTTFIEKLLPALRRLGISVGTVKHDAHSFEMDHEGKDSWRHRQAGAETVVVSSPSQVAVIKSVESEMWLNELAEEFFSDRQLIIVEGYYLSDYPKIEVHRADAHQHPLCDVQNETEKKLMAVVSDTAVNTGRPIFGLEEAGEVATYIARQHLGWVHNGMWGGN
ncbi:molybdopterin-guanine dinucleotide biosynthesis protein B [Pseudodesulfovibrio piezophilus]|uniref:Molybdopterin-guanine dinucleotide biosynthesis protein B n=1 Tax=Pseudodesulfovibrio piezophilus (strain DSM 21447 / JCM 15486 / C1TLV30) TaxID=1322246 RepID=M1WKJ4_PSEP2|nr:molybdopterin-guanine dinucleotide biosynthesis protein B [Pseudodesulfovibrio piezophilus]CCH49706.1 Molybdopterin-guanine dinucleotide biosynthesis protein B [Pseudodesulfovibrio piezophilus C1TLV30]